jgi:cell surface protein SprA
MANFQSATHAEIEEPYTPINKSLYPEQYRAWKDSVKQSIRSLGTPLDYQQSFQASYQLPLNKLPILDWVNSDASYNATYSWLRGTELDDGTTLGNTISNNRTLNINGALNLETLYNHSPFLKKVNERFKKAPAKKTAAKKTAKKTDDKAKDAKDKAAEAKDAKAKKDDAKEQKALPKNKNTFQKEITLTADTVLEVKHSKKSKRLLVSARNEKGRQVKLKWKVKDENTISVRLPKELIADSALKLKLSVLPKEPLDKQWWYNPAQQVARLLMMVRTVNISYRNQRSMTLPGFTPNIGDAFGQRTGSVLSPGLDFAFGLAGDGYLDKAKQNGWLLMNESVATPSTSSATEDLQLRATLEPLRDLKIDLNATRTSTRARSVQFMYEGSPTTQSGAFNMTTISLKSAFEAIGNANSGYQSRSFDRFCELIPQMQQRLQQRYTDYQNARTAQTVKDGQTVQAASTALNSVGQYSGDVLIPAFLEAYTGSGDGLGLFPALSRLLPNWTVRYTGLSKIPWLADRFKNVNINHAYKSLYSVTSYSSYSSWTQLHGDLGYVTATDGSLTPSSMYNIATVSLQESFSPLLGVDVTLQNNMTVKLEYRTQRNLNLSMTSVQLNESRSNDWVIGLGYKLSNFNIFSMGGGKRKAKGSNKTGRDAQNNQNKQGTQNRSRGGVNHDLNMRLDISLRSQAAITRDIASGVSSASSGNSAFKLSFAADYTLSRMLTLSAYYDRQTNTPLLSSSSYPTTTRDFGLALKFSLTR